MWEYRAQLLDVHDGDTIKLLVDTGFSSRQEVSIRLKDVHAPELSQPGGRDARMFVYGWLDVNMNHRLTWPLFVHTEPNTRPEPVEIQTFVRYVGTVALLNADPSLPSLNQAIISLISQHPEWSPGM